MERKSRLLGKGSPMWQALSTCIILLTLTLGWLHGVAASTAAPPVSPPAQLYIRVVEEQGVWWFQDDRGRKFFSLGVNCVAGCYGHAEETPLAPLSKTRSLSLLRDWGFNTAGAWSSPSVWDDLYVADQIYTGFVPTQHDVFDEAFWRGEYAEHLQREVKPFLGKKNFIGYFLDNEPEWNAREIAAFYLSLRKDRPGSRVFVRYLTTAYRGSIKQLNRAWGTSYTSFDTIPGSRPPARASFALEQGVMQSWRTKVAATYYRRYAAMVRALDPHHLILGVRYRGIPDLELFKALTPYFDVNSINDYNRYGHLRDVYADLYKASGKPLMITEFSFSGFPHPGQPSCLFVDVYTQERRGIGYYKYVLQAARAPFMVGMHWFMWMDFAQQDGPTGGYPFPPEQNVGLLSHDEGTIYAELESWIQRTNTAVEAAHQAARWETRPSSASQRRTVPRFVPAVDGDLAEWPKHLAIQPSRVYSLLEHVPADHTYFLAWDEEALYLAADVADANLIHPPQDKDCRWTGDYLVLHLRRMQGPQTPRALSASFVIYPIGAGPDRQQPYTVQREGPWGAQAVPAQVAKRLKPGGYTLEARLPMATLQGSTGLAGTVWTITLRSQNVEEISQVEWEGTATLGH
jgi:hypothetical protein